MELILQQQTTLESLELQQRWHFLRCLPCVTDEELAVWMLVENDLGISRALCEEWLKRHPEC